MSEKKATDSIVIDKTFVGTERHLDFLLLSRKHVPMEDRGSDPPVGCLHDSGVGEQGVRAFTVGGHQRACIKEMDHTVHEERTEKV